MPKFTLKFCLANIWRLGTAVVSIHMEDHININTMITRESAQTSAEKVRKKSYFFMTSSCCTSGTVRDNFDLCWKIANGSVCEFGDELNILNSIFF